MRTIALSVLALSLLGCSDAGPGGEICADQTLEVCQVFRLVNEERAAQGLPAYGWSPDLALAAQLHAEDMHANDYFSHDSQDGRSFVDRVNASGYDGAPRGENIARGQRSPEQVMMSWMESDGHRANILSEGSNEIGVGYVDFHWVQVFGRAAPMGE